MSSKHPKWGKNDELYYIPKNATKLIIGTMPPARICDKELDKNDIDFFYGSHDNYFWNIMRFLDDVKVKKLSDKDLNNYNNIKFDNVVDCKKFLDKNKIGIIDIVKECTHKLSDRGKPLASDDALFDIIPIELIDILKNHKEINTIFCTSKRVIELLNKYYSTKVCSKIEAITFKDVNQIYRLYKLYSPTRRIFNRYKDNRKIYLEDYYKLID